MPDASQERLSPLTDLAQGVMRRDDDGSVSADAVRQYVNEIGQVALLTAEEEVDLAKRISAANYAQRLLDAGDTAMTLEDRRRFLRIVRLGAIARRALTEANLRLVVSVARRYVVRNLPLIDLIQEGNIGLMRAVEKFDHTKGFKFSTYASWWIRQMIGRAVADQSRTIRIPVHLVEAMNKVRRTERELMQQLGREPTVEELARACDVPVSRVEEFRRLAVDPTSLDAPIGDDGSASMSDLIEDTDARAPLEVASQGMLERQLAEVLELLGNRERDILTRRFGLDGQIPQTLDKVGEDLGLTRERVRQIEVRALAKLRHPHHSEGLEDYLRA
ncbi:MAG: sigma-70 family RNA polymerase sigma factor [Nitriliruptoraceae bacterium]